MHAELIYNPHAGQVVVRREMEDTIAFLRRSGWTVDRQETHKPREATELARNAVRHGAKVVIAAGGDGTVNEVANGLVGTDAALGVLPLGTTNVLAMQMCIPVLNPMLPTTRVAKLLAGLEEIISWPLPANYYKKRLLDAAKVLVEGHTIAVDVGEVSGRYFLMWVGIGLDAAIVRRMSSKRKKVSGTWDYVIPTLGALRRYHSADVRITLDGRVMTGNSPLIVVSNIQLYGAVFQIGAKARVNDGKLDVCIFKGDGLFTFAHHVLKVLSRQHMQDPRVGYHQGSQIVIESAHPLPVQMDGEPFSETPVTISTLPSALKVIVSRNAPESLFI